MLTAIHSTVRVHGVVVTVPSNVVVGSWPPGGPAWLLAGRPLPYNGYGSASAHSPPGRVLSGPVGIAPVRDRHECDDPQPARLSLRLRARTSRHFEFGISDAAGQDSR
jgi:hypothetical protein